MSSGLEQAVCSLQYMAHRLEPRNEPMHRRAKVLYSGSMVYGSPQDAAYGTAAEVQHAAHSLSGLGQASLLASAWRCFCSLTLTLAQWPSSTLHRHHAHCQIRHAM